MNRVDALAPLASPAPALTFYESAAHLLAEPDPGPTPFLVERLLADGAIAAIQGPPKAGKTWLLLELARAIVTGRPALGRFAVPDPGAVLVILEESGRAALYRRLDALARGDALGADALADLHFAANRRVRLDDRGWRDALLAAGAAIRPRAIFLDPLVRLKGAEVDENSQREMGPVLDFMRDLREATGAAIVFTHHTEHEGRRMRGTSDLEAYWESKITVKRDPAGVCELSSEHREAESGPTVRYRFDWDERTRSVRLVVLDPPERADAVKTAVELVAEHIAAHPGQTAEEVAKGIGRRRDDTASALRDGEARGTFERRPSEYRDAAGRRRVRHGWYPAPEAESLPVPLDGTPWDGVETEASGADRPPLGRSRRDRPRDGEPSREAVRA